MNVIVDTTIWVEYFRAKDALLVDRIDGLLKNSLILMTPVVAAELMSGVRPAEKQEDLEAFLRTLPLCENSLDHWLRVGKTRATLLSQGLTVSTPDAHICQAALDHQAALYSLDGIFQPIAKKLPLKLFSTSASP